MVGDALAQTSRGPLAFARGMAEDNLQSCRQTLLIVCTNSNGSLGLQKAWQLTGWAVQCHWRFPCWTAYVHTCADVSQKSPSSCLLVPAFTAVDLPLVIITLYVSRCRRRLYVHYFLAFSRFRTLLCHLLPCIVSCTTSVNSSAFALPRNASCGGHFISIHEIVKEIPVASRGRFLTCSTCAVVLLWLIISITQLISIATC